jgi:uncharacterized membrane protein HdeD (DUF308 family)
MLLSYYAMSETRSPGWMRGVQIGLGAIAIILSIIVLANPGITVVSIIIVIGIILMVVGIFEIITGIFGLSANRSRWGSVGLGILALIIAGITLTFPVHTTVFVLVLLAVALLFIGIARIIRGVGDKQSRGWARGFSIGAGVIAIALSVLIMFSPVYGAVLVSFLLGIALLIIGIEIIASGISGRKMHMPGRKMER